MSIDKKCFLVSIEKEWTTLGGVQIAGAGGDSSDGPSWSKFYYIQSLVNKRLNKAFN